MTVRRKTTVMPSSRHTTNAYDLAGEFADLVTKLWDAWEPEAVVLDRETPMFADVSKVNPVNHVGKYFRCRGPLNAPRSPQGRPPICQAGGSSRGQDFAARWADTIIADAGSVEAMKDYRDGVRHRAQGRRTRPGFDQGIVSGLSAGRHDDGCSAGATAPDA